MQVGILMGVGGVEMFLFCFLFGDMSFGVGDCGFVRTHPGEVCMTESL